MNELLLLDNVAVGNISSFLNLLAFFASIFQALYLDRFERIFMLQLSAFFQLVSFLFLALIITNVLPRSFALFVFARSLPSFFKCGSLVSQAYVVDFIVFCSSSTTPSEQREEATSSIAFLVAATNVGFIVGPLLGGYLSYIAPEFPLILGTLIFLLNMCLLALMSDPKEHEKDEMEGNGIDDSSPFHLSSSSSSYQLEEGLVGGGNKFSTTSRRSGSIHQRRARTKALSQALRIEENPNSTLFPRKHLKNNQNNNGINNNSNYNVVSFNNNNSSSSTSSTSSSSSSSSALFLLHLKFTFQVGNALYEAWFAQHLRYQLSASNHTLGLLFSLIGCTSALANGLIVRMVSANARESEIKMFLLLSAVGQSVGLLLWGMAIDLFSVSIGAILVALCSNLYLGLLQGILATGDYAPAPANGSTASSSSSSSSLPTSATIGKTLTLSSDSPAPVTAPASLPMGGAGRAIGFSAACDRVRTANNQNPYVNV